MFNPGEIWWNTTTGLTLYAIRWKQDGSVFVTDGSSAETYGAAGHDADDYDVAMTEADSSGYYTAEFDASGNITERGAYNVVVYRQIGANPADSDPAIAQGEIYWDKDSELNEYTITNRIRHTLGPWR